MKANMAHKEGRFQELEGLRGVAAIMVACYHFFLAFFAVAFLSSNSGIPAVAHTQIEGALYGNPIAAIFSGTFAVAIFFVLSGFVLSIGFFTTGKLEIVKKLAAKRYLRLMLPALASIFLAYLLIRSGIPHVQQAAAITQSGWLQAGWAFVPHIWDVIRDGIFTIFVSPGTNYNNVLWTMTTEFIGSFIVFGFLAVFSNVKLRGIFYVALLLLTSHTWLAAFIIGMIIADVYAQGKIRQRKAIVQPLLLVVAGLFLGGYPIAGVVGTIYDKLTPAAITGFPWQIFYLTIGATLVVLAVLTSSHLTRFFARPSISKLGKYTFSFYLTHLLVLYTFTTTLFVEYHLRFGLGYSLSAILAFISSVPVAIVVAYLFERFIDAPSIRLSSLFSNIVLGYQKLSPEFVDAVKKSYVNARSFAANLRTPSSRVRPAETAEEPANELI